MSVDEQPTLDEFADAARPGMARTKPPEWTAMSTDAESQCKQCGGHISDKFGRVFGDENDVVYACPSCATRHELHDGGAAEPRGDER